MREHDHTATRPEWKVRSRDAIERAIEEAIDILDVMDGDADLEWSLGWPNYPLSYEQMEMDAGLGMDLEDQCEDEDFFHGGRI